MVFKHTFAYVDIRLRHYVKINILLRAIMNVEKTKGINIQIYINILIHKEKKFKFEIMFDISKKIRFKNNVPVSSVF